MLIWMVTATVSQEDYSSEGMAAGQQPLQSSCDVLWYQTESMAPFYDDSRAMNSHTRAFDQI